jgi:hypothetical protein
VAGWYAKLDSRNNLLEEGRLTYVCASRRGKVVVIVGDTGVKGKADAKLPSRIIDAAKERDAARLVLVAPGGSSGGGGFFGGGRGGGAGKPPPPSKLEEVRPLIHLR